jgi:hypothetical protein
MEQLISKYFISNFISYVGRISGLLLLERNSATMHFWNKKNNGCDIKQLDFIIFEIQPRQISWKIVRHYIFGKVSQ